jgi:hypothetical protein
MRFKDWILRTENWSSGNLPYTNGGVEDYPGQNLNTNMPVQSKYSTQDGCDKKVLDATDSKKKPDEAFGFISNQDKNMSRERSSQWIDKNRRRARFVTIPSDTIY